MRILSTVVFASVFAAFFSQSRAQTITFGTYWHGAEEFTSEAVQAPGFDPAKVFSDPGSLVQLPYGVDAYQLGSIPLSQQLVWFRSFESTTGLQPVHAIGELELIVYQQKSNGRYLVRLSGKGVPPSVEVSEDILVEADIEILDRPGSLVESARVFYGSPKCGAVASRTAIINSNPLLYADVIRLRARGPNYTPSGASPCN